MASISQLGKNLRQTEQDRKKLETAKKDWLASVSHDLKPPLAYITGHATLLLTPGSEFTGEEIKKHLQEIYRKSMYIGELIDDLSLSLHLDAGGALPLCPRCIDLVECVQKCVNDIAGAPGASGYDFSFITQESVVYADVDEKLMSRAICNLLVNGIEHNPEQTQLTITLTRQGGRYVELKVEDNGAGMEPEIIDQCFRKYYSGKKRQGKNKGLGLFFAKNIVEAHGGQLAVESNPGAGTCFYVTLPVQKENSTEPVSPDCL